MIDSGRSGEFRDTNISMVASCRANEKCYDGPSGGEFTINLLRPLCSHPVYTNDIALRDQRHVPVTLSQPISSGSLLTDLNVAFSSSNQRISQRVNNSCNMCYEFLFAKLCECCNDCCRGITNCFTNCYEGIHNAISQSLNNNQFLINLFCFLFCPCIALLFAFFCWKTDSEACKAWYCNRCYKEGDNNQEETPYDQL